MVDPSALIQLDGYGLGVTNRVLRDVAALNADVVGYSRLMADDHEATAAQMAWAREQVAAAVIEHGGTLVNFVGDNFMAVFDRTIDAIRSAMAIASQVEAANTPLPESRRLRFRMGVQRGPVTVTDGSYEGDALNVAARLQAIARPGGLSVSGSVYRDLDEPALRFRPVGARQLKNIPEPVEVYEFVDLPAHGSDDISSRLALDLPSIAVLPLHAEGVDPEVAARAAVVRDDLIHRLSSIPELTVMDAAGTEAGSGTGARYMLECGVHQAGNRLRAHATLFEVPTLSVVKAMREAGTVEDIIGLSEALAERVGHVVEVELVVGIPAGLYAELEDAEVIQKVYLGWYHLRAFTAEGWIQSLSMFEEVAKARPELPYGWVLLAFANWIGASNEWAPDPAATMAIASEQANHGAALGDPTGMAQAVEAAVLMSTGRTREAAEALQGLEISRPTCDVTYGLRGSLNRYMGKWQEAVEELDKAMRLTAVNKPWYPTVKSCSLLIGGRPEQAAAIAESVLEFQPNNVEALLVLAAAQLELGLHRRAEATAHVIHERFPALNVSKWLDDQPYWNESLVQNWRADLAALDLLPAT
jgi:adenylate cyclase